MSWRWGNVPLPETHLVGLGAGVLLHAVAPLRPPWAAWVGQATAWPLLLLPVVLAATQVVVGREERSLERRFGAAYRSYRASVRRYL